MTKIKFNNAINKVGVEFEGLFCEDLISNLDLSLFEKNRDSSIVRNEVYTHDPYEIITKPCNANELNRCLKVMNELFLNKAYILNYSTGLHFHISVNKMGFASCRNLQFYSEVCNMIQNKAPKVYLERLHNRYCSVDIENYYFYELIPGNRYKAINFTKKGGSYTIEVRLYGGKYATIQELTTIIQNTLIIVKKYYDKHTSIQDQIVIDTQQNKIRKDLTEKLYKTKYLTITTGLENKNKYFFYKFNDVIKTYSHYSIPKSCVKLLQL